MNVSLDEASPEISTLIGDFSGCCSGVRHYGPRKDAARRAHVRHALPASRSRRRRLPDNQREFLMTFRLSEEHLSVLLLRLGLGAPHDAPPPAVLHEDAAAGLRVHGRPEVMNGFLSIRLLPGNLDYVSSWWERRPIKMLR